MKRYWQPIYTLPWHGVWRSWSDESVIAGEHGDPEEVDKIISDLRNQIPSLQMQLHQAEGYKQALVDMEKLKEQLAAK